MKTTEFAADLAALNEQLRVRVELAESIPSLRPELLGALSDPTGAAARQGMTRLAAEPSSARGRITAPAVEP